MTRILALLSAGMLASALGPASAAYAADSAGVDTRGFTQDELGIMAESCKTTGPELHFDEGQPYSCHPQFVFDGIQGDRLAVFSVEGTYQGYQVALFSCIEEYHDAKPTVTPVLAGDGTGYLGAAPNKFNDGFGTGVKS